jgi:hypothetical protein
VSIAVYGNLLYVLNARDGGSVQGFTRIGAALVRIPGWHRDLGLVPAQTPEFTSTPGQVAFTPDGSRLVVNGSDIDVFTFTITLSGYSDDGSGILRPAGTTATDPGTVDAAVLENGRYLYVQAGAAGTVDEFRVNPGGSLTSIGSVTVPGAAGGEGIAAS